MVSNVMGASSSKLHFSILHPVQLLHKRMAFALLEAESSYTRDFCLDTSFIVHRVLAIVE